jgi:16S rRNA (uracil1498-N3)-methyltransferase
MIPIFLSPDELTANKVSITGDNARHLSLVMRVQPGDSIAILDGRGKRYICKVLAVHKKEVTAEKIREELFSAESPISITLAQGLSKGDRMDFAIQKSTELGAKKIVPVITERSQLRSTEKISRWRKIALSASQQSGREVVPEISDAVDLKKFFDSLSPDGDKLILYESHEERNLKNVLSGLKDIKKITLLVGPEGGFSKDEVISAVENGFIAVSLGPRILRTETAPIAAISIIQYELGDMV